MAAKSLICAAALSIIGTIAVAEGKSDLVAICAAEVHASGSYVLATKQGIRQVVPAEGGTAAGARSINDCLLDRQNVQFGTGQVATHASAAQDGQTCRDIRNRNIATGLALTVGLVTGLGGTDAAILGGLAGTAAGISGVQRRYRDCVASEPTFAGSKFFVRGCRPGDNPLRGGVGYCAN